VVDGWESVGPTNRSGVIRDLAVAPSAPYAVYAAAWTGGLWQHLTGPQPSWWNPLTDETDAGLVTTAVAVAPSDHSILYFAGKYVRRSEDWGQSWGPRSTRSFDMVNRLIVDPVDDRRLYAATSEGLFGSMDGGLTWSTTPLLSGDITDAAMDPDDAAILYAGVRNGGVYKSGDAGASWGSAPVLSWSQASSPSYTAIRLALGHQGGSAGRTVAAKLDEEVFISKDAGATWPSKGKQGGTTNGDRCSVVGVDPFDDDIVFAGGFELHVTRNGGARWDVAPDPKHVDLQRVVFDPRTRDTLYVSTDGGVAASTDGGRSWVDLNAGLVTTQAYRAQVNGEAGYANAQDWNGFGTTSVSSGIWDFCGSSMETQNVYKDPKHPELFYMDADSMAYRAGYRMSRQRLPTTGVSDDYLEHYGNFRARGIAVDPRAAQDIVLVGSGDPQAWSLMRTTDAYTVAPHWGPEQIAISEEIASIAFAPSASGVVYATTYLGNVFRKDDASSQAAWQHVGSAGVAWVANLAVNTSDDSHLYLVDGFSLLVSRDSGATWPRVARAGHELPDGYVNWVLPTGLDFGHLLLATYTGVYASDDEGSTWARWDEGLPKVEAYHLSLDLRGGAPWVYAATLGRGVWRRSLA
jgi:hypothetical protein